MYQDLHSHTYYSFCGRDNPEQVVEAAIAGGLNQIGITDHNHGIVMQRLDFFRQDESLHESDAYRTLKRYYDHIGLVREKYRDKITVLQGIEVCLLGRPNHNLPENADISYYDFALIEGIADPSAITKDLFGYAKRLGCKCGIAHTDMFGFISEIGEDPLDYFERMAEAGIFWELNVNYDSTHGYNEHEYVKRFFKNPEQQDIIRRSGVEVSIGFDGHKVEDYLPDRIKNFCDILVSLGIRQPFADI